MQSGADTQWYSSAVAASQASDSAAKDVEVAWSIACGSLVREVAGVYN